MSLKRIARTIAARRGLDPEQVHSLLTAGMDQIEQETIANGRCVVRGLGVFTLKQSPARKARNPTTGNLVDVPAVTKIAFRQAVDRQRVLFQREDKLTRFRRRLKQAQRNGGPTAETAEGAASRAGAQAPTRSSALQGRE